MPISDIVTVADIVRVHGREQSDRTALILGERDLTWGDLAERAERVANGLLALGVGPQDRVAFLDKNGLEHFELFFGAALVNAVCVDVNWRLVGAEVAYIVNDSMAKVFVVGPDFVPLLDEIASELTGVTKFLVIGDHPTHDNWDVWVSDQPDGDPGVAVSRDDVAMQLYSSGTTGRPKGVMLTHHNFFGLLPAAKQIWELDDTARNLVAMPLFHIGGGGWALAGMYEGCTSIIVRDLDPAEVVRLLGAQRITHAFLVPAVLQFMLMVPGVETADFSSLKVFVYGASPISEAVLARCVTLFGCKFWQAYGLTETTGAVVNLPPEDHDPQGPNRHRLRSCGLAGPGVEIRIVDPETMAPLQADQVGEICIRSAQVMKGYWNLPEDTAKAITQDGWFRSGDAGYLDAAGYLYIHDRVKDMIVSGGENVYPAEVENVLMAHVAVSDVAVIGVPHEKWGETPKAMVVRVVGAQVTADDLIEHCRSHLARYKCPTSIEWLDTLPRNPSGKVLKKDLRAPFWVGRQRHVN
jgi:long-chain acyl-CoA synthetase